MSTHISNPLATIELTTGPNPNPTHAIIWMHGLGADGNDFVPIIDELDLPETTSIRFIFPHAPKQPITINGGFIMRAWYDIRNTELDHAEDEKGLERSRQLIIQLIEKEISRGIPFKNIVLAGFSQGGAMSLFVGLRHTEKLGGIMVLSGYLPLAQQLERDMYLVNRATPIFMGHGSEDMIVPVQLANRSRQQLIAQGHSVEWHEYNMAHSVCNAEITDLSKWLRRILL
ncbi:MAG: dienelactone hydrolase family protein [Nitrosomonas sp.]|nr:dienelactone hydrolase family protein [Nitrosomonas sp.]